MRITIAQILILINVIIFLFTMLDTTAVYDLEDFGSQNCCPKDIYEYYCDTYTCPYETCCEYTFTDFNFASIPYTSFEKPWSLITSMFLHVDFFHIIYNMLALALFGIYLERVVGWKNFLLIYFTGGIIGSIGYVLFAAYLGEIYIPAVGASGAIYAVIIALMVIRPHDEILKPGEKGFFYDVFWVYMFGFLGYLRLFFVGMFFLVIAIFGIFTDLTFGGQSGVANSAHLGGAVAGIILGFYFRGFFVTDKDVEQYYRPPEKLYKRIAKEEGARAARRNIFGKYEYSDGEKGEDELEIAVEKRETLQRPGRSQENNKNSGDELEIVD